MRDYNYRKHARKTHINRRKLIATKLYGNGWYDIDGKYDKGKIYCSCPMCSIKTNNKGKNRLKHGNYLPSKNWKHSDLIKIESMCAKEEEIA